VLIGLPRTEQVVEQVPDRIAAADHPPDQGIFLATATEAFSRALTVRVTLSA
jgi:hypothetical protein